MPESSKAAFSVPQDFADDPTKAPLPRQLIIYDEKSNTWSPTLDKKIIAGTRYLCVSYRQTDFPNRQQLEQTVQDVCLNSKYCDDLRAYWLDYACTGSTQEEKNMDLYRIADVFRGAAKTLIMIEGNDDSVHSPGWLCWGDRLWTLPEALLSGYRGDKLLFKVGTRRVKPISLREIASHAYANGDKEMELMNAYSGEPIFAPNEMFKALWEAIRRRSSGSEEGGSFTVYGAQRVYVLMGFMSRRILPDPNESEEEAFSRLMEANGFDKQIHKKRRHSQVEELNEDSVGMANSKKRLEQGDRDVIRILEKIPYTEGMRYKRENRCLNLTRRDIMERIKLCIDNKDGKHDEKRIILLTGVAGSGKSSIANSIAFHYDSLGQLGSSFFFSAAYKEKSQPKNLLRTIARDVIEKYPDVQKKLFVTIKANLSLCTTGSIQEQYDEFLRGPLSGVVFKSPVIIVIDALDECDKSGVERRVLLNILARKITDLPSNFRIFLTARAEVEFDIFNASQHVEIFRMDEIDSHSKGKDIRTFLGRTLEPIAKTLTLAVPNWEEELAGVSGNLFIWAATACSYVLEDDGRTPYERLQTLLCLENEADSDSPVGVLYKLYNEVLNTTFKTHQRTRKTLTQGLKRFRKVLGIIMVAYEPLSSNDMDELLSPNAEATPIIRQLGALLDGAGCSQTPVKLLHTSFGDFLRNKEVSGIFHIDNLEPDRIMAERCLSVMNENLKFNIFRFDELSASYKDMVEGELVIRRIRLSKALQYSCQYWIDHIIEMSVDDFKSIQEPLQEFLLEAKHLLQWIEVMSVLRETDEARDGLLSLHKWLKIY